MKQRYIGFLIALITLFTSCEFPSQMGSYRGEEKSSVRISLGVAESNRTITSTAASLVDTFSVKLTDSAGNISSPEAVASGEEVEIIVSAEGLFTVEVLTFNSEGVQTGLGNGSGEIYLGDTLDLVVSVSFSQTTKGSMSLPVSFPSDKNISSITAYFLDEDASAISVSVDLFDEENGTANLGATEVPSGLHSLVVNFFDNGELCGSVVEAVNIWDGASISSWLLEGSLYPTRVFTADDIASSSTVPILIIAGKIVYLGLDASETLEYDISGTTDDDRITDETLTFSILGIPDNNTATYMWNNGDSTSCEEGISSIDLAANSVNGLNTLVLTLTGEDSSETIYTVTFTRYSKVEFSSDYGTEPDSQIVKYNDPASEPTVSSVTGFTFGGWFSDADFTTDWVFDTPITDNLTIYAKWIQNAGISVFISAPEYQSIYFSQFDEVVKAVSLDIDGKLPLSLPTGATSYAWLLDGTDISGETSSSYTYEPTTPGQHTLSALFVYDGVSYSGDLVVNVTNEYMVTIIPLGKSATFTEATWIYISDTLQTVNDPFDHSLSRAYSMGKFEVNYTLWSAVYTWALSNNYYIANPGQAGYSTTGSGPQTGDDAGEHPVTDISWQDILVWCNAYSEMAGLSPVYYSDTAQLSILRSTEDLTALSDASNLYTTEYANLDADGYRLPSEGEWQFAASCGGSYQYNQISGCDDSFVSTDLGTYQDYANVGTDESLSCGTKLSNMWGLFDMSGNVWEVCFDLSDVLPGEDQLDYVCTTSSFSTCISRGGSFSSTHLNGEATVGNRAPTILASSFNDQGFRLARTLQ